ncbi:serine hydrolase domain-containing protein, partial [Nocardioides dubius]
MIQGVEPGTARRLRAVLAHAQSRGRVPSVVGALARDGGPVWCEGYGDVPGDPADVQYRIGSITKTLTAVLVLQLVDEEQLGLDTPIGDVLGAVPYADRRVGDLLSHLSGMQAEPSGAWWERAGRGDFAALMAAEAEPAGAVPVGSRYHYTNLAFAMLGEAAARLRGTDWWSLVQERLLAPLGMSRTTFSPQQPAARGYSVHPYRGELLPEPASDTGAMAPAGQLWSTAADLLRWGQFLLDGHHDVLGKQALEAAYVVRSSTLDGVASGAHGLGFRTCLSDVGPLIGHGGSMPGFLAGCLVDRAHG